MKLAPILEILPDLSMESAEHDEVWFGSAKTPENLPPDAEAVLEKLGLHWNDEYGCWHAFT